MPDATDPLCRFEDTLNDLRSIARIVLFATEHGDDEEFGRLRETVCTQMYIIMEKLDICADSHKAAFLATMRTGQSGENLH